MTNDAMDLYTVAFTCYEWKTDNEELFTVDLNSEQLDKLKKFIDELVKE